MAPGSKLPLFIEIFVGLAAYIFLAAALVSPEWIEKTLGVSPDNGDGSIEWGTTLGAATVFLAMSWLVRRDWRTHKAPVGAAQVVEPR
jgi:hypothetical protein